MIGMVGLLCLLAPFSLAHAGDAARTPCNPVAEYFGQSVVLVEERQELADKPIARIAGRARPIDAVCGTSLGGLSEPFGAAAPMRALSLHRSWV